MNGTVLEDESLFEGEEEERDSFVQPARGLRSFALVSYTFFALDRIRYGRYLGTYLFGFLTYFIQSF